MAEKAQARATAGSGATKVLINSYVYCTYLVIAALFIFRMQWFGLVLRSVQHGYDTTELESMHEQPLWHGYVLVTGDASIICYIAVAFAFLLLVFFGRKGVASHSKSLLIAIRVMVYYSIFMIFAQIVFLDLVSIPSMRHMFEFNTCLRGHFTEATPLGADIFCVNDPHYVTLAVALFALIMLIDRNIISAVVKLFKGWKR